MAFPKAGAVSRSVKANNPTSTGTSGSFPSTNVPSPPRPRQPIGRARVQYEITETQSHHFSEYTEDFAVPDDDNDQPDSLGFMPVRQGGSIRKRPVTRGEQSERMVGKPITEDPELRGKTTYEIDLCYRFMDACRELRTKVMDEEGFQRIDSVCTDKTLRTLGLRLPTSKLILFHLIIFSLPATNYS